MKKILIIEDDYRIQKILHEMLVSCGYLIIQAYDGQEGIETLEKNQDTCLVILDLMMPKLDGYQVCRRIRKNSRLPIMILTALDEEEAQIKCFDLEADDYITKPFSLIIVQKRIEALLRRIPNEDNISMLRYKTLKLDCEKYKFYCNGEDIYLTPLEYSIMHLFMQHPRRVFSKEELIEYIWNYSFCGSTNSVNFHIMNMRKKGIEQIETVRGMGYRLV